MNYFFRLFSYSRNYRWEIVFNFIFNLLSIVFSLFSLSMIIPFLGLLFDSQELVLSPVSWSFSTESLLHNFYYYLSRVILEKGKLDALFLICVLVVILFFFKNLFKYFANFFLGAIRSGVVYDIRKSIFKKLLDLPLGYYSDERKGDIMARITADVQEVEWSVVSSLEVLFRDPVTVIAYLVVMVVMSPSLTLFVLIILPVAGLMIGSVGKSLKRTSVKGQEKMGDLLSATEETISGLRIIKAFNAEGAASAKFDKINSRYRQLLTRIYRKRDLASPMSEFLGTAVLMIVMYFGGHLVLGEAGKLHASVFIGFIAIFSQLIPPAKAFTTAYYNIQKGMASANRIQAILEAPEIIKEPLTPIPLNEFKSTITFEKVSFAYQRISVLEEINLRIEKGKTIAVVGQSGAGKTTLADLLPRFYDCTEGSISIDGINIKEIKTSDLRNLMGIVSQDSVLFNESFHNNIAIGRRDTSREEVISAARIANAHEFITLMESGYDTNIGDGGNKLSGGQKQRISIARAVLKNPPILILDEATSALDTESERLVQEALINLMKNRTSLVIAHRLSTIQNADEIIVMNKGRIVERGNHVELLNSGGIYKKLHQLQE